MSQLVSDMLASPWLPADLLSHALMAVAALPFVLASYALAFVLVQQLVSLLWNGVARPIPQQVEVRRGQLRLDNTSVALDDPELTAELDHTWFDARLKLTTATQRLVLHGDHAQLHALQRWLRGRGTTSNEDRGDVVALLSALRGRALQRSEG